MPSWEGRSGEGCAGVPYRESSLWILLNKDYLPLPFPGHVAPVIPMVAWCIFKGGRGFSLGPRKLLLLISARTGEIGSEMNSH